MEERKSDCCLKVTTISSLFHYKKGSPTFPLQTQHSYFSIHFPNQVPMGGNKHKKSHSSFSFFGFFKSKRARKGEHYEHDELSCPTKVWPSDADKCHRWVAEPGIDRKAKDYIDRIHRNRVLETERQTVTVAPSGTRTDV